MLSAQLQSAGIGSLKKKNHTRYTQTFEFITVHFISRSQTDIISKEYLEGCYQLGQQYPDLCSSIFLMCEKGK